MSQHPLPPRPPFFSQIDVSQGPYTMLPEHAAASHGLLAEQTQLLRQILAAQDRQNELLEELVNLLGAAQKQRAAELGQWRQANPELARSCRTAAEVLGRAQTEFLQNITGEINENLDVLLDGDFMLHEFVDRFGPRLVHLNGLLQVLSQLSATPETSNSPRTR